MDNNNFRCPWARHLTLNCLLINIRCLCVCCTTFLFVCRWESEQFKHKGERERERSSGNVRTDFQKYDVIYLLEGQLWLMTLQLQKKKKKLLDWGHILRELSHISLYINYAVLLFYCCNSICNNMKKTVIHNWKFILFLYYAKFKDGISPIKIGVMAQHLQQH